MSSKGLFLSVCELVGEAVILGRVHRVEFRDSALVIRGVNLTDATAILGRLATADLVVAGVGPLLPGASAPAAPPPAAKQEQPEALVPATSPPTAAFALTSPPPAEVFGPETTVGQVRPPSPAAVEAPSGAPAPTPAPTPAATESAPGSAPQDPAPSPPVPAIPPAVMTAQTLRPILGWLHTEKGVRGLDPMVAAVRDLAPAGVKLVAEILRTEPATLAARVQRTMTALELL